MESRLLLDVIIGQSPSVLQLLASKDETLLVWGNALLVLDLGLDVFNGVRGLNLEGDGLASQGLDEDLHGLKDKRKLKSSDSFKCRYSLRLRHANFTQRTF